MPNAQITLGGVQLHTNAAAETIPSAISRVENVEVLRPTPRIVKHQIINRVGTKKQYTGKDDAIIRIRGKLIGRGSSLGTLKSNIEALDSGTLKVLLVDGWIGTDTYYPSGNVYVESIRWTDYGAGYEAEWWRYEIDCVSE